MISIKVSLRKQFRGLINDFTGSVLLETKRLKMGRRTNLLTEFGDDFFGLPN